MIDRYYYSGCVYSAAKNNPSLDLAWARHPEVGLPRPDLCLFLDISNAEAEKRGGYGEERYEKREMQDRVRKLFNDLMEGPDKDDFIRIDAGRSLEEVQKSIRTAVQETVEKVDKEGSPLRFVQPR